MASNTWPRHLRILLAMVLLYLCGFVLVMHSRRMTNSVQITLYGQKQWPSGGRVALRFVARDVKWARPLVVEKLRVALSRPASAPAVLHESLPSRHIVHINLSVPRWSSGPARLEIELSTRAGGFELAGEVLLGSKEQKWLAVAGPDRPLESPAVVLSAVPDGAKEVAVQGESLPARILLLPEGGAFSTSFEQLLVLRVLDATGNPVPDVSVEGDEADTTDEQGFAMIRNTYRTAWLKLHVRKGRFRAEAAARPRWAPTPVRLTPSVSVTDSLGLLLLRVESLAASTPVYLEGWSDCGWFHSTEVVTKNNRAVASIPLQAGCTGPVVFRARLDPDGSGSPAGQARIMIARDEKLAGDEFVAWLAGRPGARKALAELGALAGLSEYLKETDSFIAWLGLLSLVEPTDGEIPVLIDGTGKIEKEKAAHRKAVAAVGLGMASVAAAALLVMLAAVVLRRARLAGMKRSAAALWLATGAAIISASTAWLFWAAPL